MPEQKLLDEYRQLYVLTDTMDRLLRDAGVDFCREMHANLGRWGGWCPLCVARRRFEPKQRPRIVKNQECER